MQKKSVIVIPSRLASTRLPEKALADICGKSLIVRVWDRACQCSLADDVIVATDHERIFDEVTRNGGKAVMTSVAHKSGTDRIAEVAHGVNADIIINLQGDEPLIDPGQIDQLIARMHTDGLGIGTLCRRLTDSNTLFDYNVVKVIRDKFDRALYFSRQAIPAIRDLPYRKWMDHAAYFRHVGMYAFQKETLLNLSQLAPTGLEEAESLEQLRWLQNGYAIHCFETSYDSIGVDTPEDLEKVREVVLKEKYC